MLDSLLSRLKYSTQYYSYPGSSIRFIKKELSRYILRREQVGSENIILRLFYECKY